jgi:predicted DCC family thiol-disulfide oxidoreductase YuxK
MSSNALAQQTPDAAPRVTGLPSPDQRPGADVVIFDGECGFCRAQVARLDRWDRGGRLAFLSLHDPRVAERYPDLSQEDLLAAMYLVTPTGERHRGAAAARYLSRKLPRMWLLAPLLHIPGSLPCWQWMYDQVARRRYLLGGRVADPDACENGACRIHR